MKTKEIYELLEKNGFIPSNMSWKEIAFHLYDLFIEKKEKK